MAIPFLSDIRLPSSGKVYLWTGHNSNFLQYNLWHASASGGMYIKNIANSGDIYFQTNSTTALTLDSSQNATFVGDIAVGPKSNATVQVSESGNSTVKMLAGSVGRVGTYSSHNLNLMANSNTVLTLDTSQNATFAGDVISGNIRINKATNPNLQLYRSDATTQLWDIAIDSSGRLLFREAASEGGTKYTRFQIDDTGEATFEGRTDLQKDLRIRGNDASGSLGVVRFLTDSNNRLIIDTGNDGSNQTIIDSSGNATFAGVITYGNSTGVLTYGSDRAILRSASSKALELQTNGGTTLMTGVDANATFAGDVTVGALTSGQTAQLTVNNEGGVPSVARFKSRTNKAHIEISDNDTTGYISSENGLFSLGRHAGVNAANININGSSDVGIGTSSPGNKLHVTTSDDIVAKFESTDNNGKIRILDPNNSAYLGINNTEIYLGGSGTSSSVGNIRLNIGNANSGRAGYACFGGAPTSGNKWRVSETIDTDTDANMTSIGADMNVTGSTALSADKTYRGILADVDSDATGGDTNHEVRLYGVDANVVDTGDADLMYGVQGNVTNSRTSALDNVTVLAGGRFTGNADNAAGTISNAYGIYANARNKNSGVVNTIYGGRLEVSAGTSDSDISNAHGVYAKVEPGANYSGTINSARGAYIEVESENNNVFNTVYGIQLNIDHNGGTITDAYQMKLTTSGTIADDNWGIHSTGAAKNRIDGKIGIGVTPSYDFHLKSSASPTKVFIENDGSNQASVDLSNDDRHVRLITDSTNAFRIYDQTATADRFKLDNNGFVTLPSAYLELKNLNSHAHINATSSSLMIQATNIQAMGNLIPDGTGNRNLGASNRYWAETYTNGVTSGGNIVINSNTPVLTLGVLNTSTGNSKIQFYSKNSGTSNAFAIQYNKDTSIDRLEFIDGGGTAAFQFHNGGNAEFEGTLTASQINTGQGATEVHLMNQNLRTTDDVTFDDLTVTGNLTITGDINSYNVTDLDITDKTITLGKGQVESASGGSGLVVDGSSASILWDETNDTWDFNKGIYITGNDGNVNLDGNAAIIFDNTNNNNGWYIRNGGSNAATLQFGLGTSPGSNIKHTFAGDGSVSFATYVNAATGFRMASGQAIDFIDSNIGYNSIERNTTVGGLQINTGDSASVNILDNGRVGIGTNAPGMMLHIKGGDEATMKLESTSGEPAVFWAPGGSSVKWENRASASRWQLYQYDESEWVFNIYDAKVGIGTVSPYYKLDTRFTNTDTSFSGGGSGNWGSNGIRIENTSSTANTMAAIHLRNSDADIHIAGIRQGTDDSDLGFFFESSEKVRFTKDGKVGIGTASPAYKLDVNGGAIFLDSDWPLYLGGTNAFIEGNSSGTIVRINASAGFKVTDGGDTRFKIDTDGKVGIGEATPARELHITATAISGATPTTFGHVMIEDTDAQIDLVSTQGGTWGSAINFKEHNTSDSNLNDIWSIARKTTGDLGDSSLNFNFGTSNQHDNANKVNFSSTGKITTAGGVNYTGGTIAQATTVLHTNNIVYNIGGSNGIIISNADYSDRYYITNSDHRWEVATADAMRLNSTGLGIGTTSPAYKLDVAGDIKCTTSLKIDAGSPFLGLYNSGTEKAYLQWSQSNDYLTLQSDGDTRFITVGTERIRIKSDGKVGIGTTAPTYKLSVASGGIEAGGKITYSKSYGSLNATGNAVAGITAAANGNGSSCGFIFTCFGHTGAYQRIVYSCYNGSGTWYAKKVIDEGTNQLDVAASANGSTITFTFKATDSTMSYTPRVTVEATGHNINSTYA